MEQCPLLFKFYLLSLSLSLLYRTVILKEKKMLKKVKVQNSGLGYGSSYNTRGLSTNINITNNNKIWMGQIAF
jgi:hypothetical protein